MPAREPRSSKDPKRSETTQAVASAGPFVSAREPGSSKGPRRSETAQAVASAGKFVPARSARVELKLEACEECTSCIRYE